MRWTSWMAGAIVLVTISSAAFYVKRDTVSFDSLEQAKTRLEAAGFHCTSDCADCGLSTGFLVTSESSTWYEASALCKIGKMGPEWKGKVWVSVNPDSWRLECVPEGAGVRGWGEVVAFGDDEFLVQIDAVLEAPSIY